MKDAGGELGIYEHWTAEDTALTHVGWCADWNQGWAATRLVKAWGLVVMLGCRHGQTREAVAAHTDASVRRERPF